MGIPLLITLSNFFLFDINAYYAAFYQQCVFSTNDNVTQYVINVIAVYTISNLIVLIAYFWVLIKLRLQRKKLNSSRNLTPPRITIQLVIYVITYEIGVIASFIQYTQIAFSKPFVSDQVMQWTRILRWAQHFCPIGLVYFHPIMLQKYKCFFNYLRWIFSK